MTDTYETSTTAVPPERTRCNDHEEIAKRITGHMMRYRSFSDPESWRRFSIAQIRTALDAAQRRGR
jgi:hypothetical protein